MQKTGRMLQVFSVAGPPLGRYLIPTLAVLAARLVATAIGILPGTRSGSIFRQEVEGIERTATAAAADFSRGLFQHVRVVALDGFVKQGLYRAGVECQRVAIAQQYV